MKAPGADLAERFEEHRTRLRGVAYRMLGSLSEADDAIQEAWLRLSRAEATGIENLGGWLTTVLARVCLDMLRSRRSRREEPFTPDAPEPVATGTYAGSPEGIAPIVGRSADAARQLASRARRRVRAGGAPEADLVRQREVVEAFIGALRAGDLEGLLAVLDRDLVVRADMAAVAPTEIRGAAIWAKGVVAYGHLAQLTRPALVDGAVGVVVAARGKLVRALRFTITNGRITEIDIIGNPRRLGGLDVSIVD